MNSRPSELVAFMALACVALIAFALPNALNVSAQTSISTDGVIESTSGGFKFPDMTVQMTASGNVEPYNEVNTSCETSSAVVEHCYFDVPSGKLLKIERFSGVTDGGNLTFVGIGFNLSAGVIGSSIHVPATSQVSSGSVFEASGPVYVGDHDGFMDGGGSQRDFIVSVHTDGTGAQTVSQASVIGQLLADNQP